MMDEMVVIAIVLVMMTLQLKAMVVKIWAQPTNNKVSEKLLTEATAGRKK